MVETLLWLNEHRDCRCRVLALVRNRVRAELRFAAYRGRPDLVFVEGDVGGVPLPEESIHLIVHAASPASPKIYGSDPVGVMRANLLGAQRLLERARQSRPESFLFFSSGEVYGQVAADRIPTKESDYGYLDILDPRSCYGESKRASETLGVSYWYQHQVPFKVVRPFHTYGPGMALDDGRVFADFVADVVQRRNLALRGDGKAIRSFCYIADAVEAFFRVLLSGRAGLAYNVGNPEGALSIRELADLVAGLIPELGLRVDCVPRAADSSYMVSPITRNVPDISEISSLGWRPRHSPREGFVRTLAYFGVVPGVRSLNQTPT
jgi:nucleoside-diphosphate-sugar epimerase